MRYISLFSGIEAASVAWEPLGWEPLAFCEIDEFPSAVLAHRFPDVENLGDITKVDWKEVIARHGRPDVVVGGSPCQSFSIAGGRESLEGESRLMFEFIRAVDEIRPHWFLWENVPAVLNTRDNAFAQLLGEVQKLGYGSLAWRVLDAQFFGVAQRRRRVFLVGRLGEGGSAAAVLFEPESLRGDNPSSREKREALARAAGRGPASGGGDGCFVQNTRNEVRLQGGDGTVVGALGASGSANGQGVPFVMATGQANAEVTQDMTPTLNCAHEQPIVVSGASTQYGDEVAGTLTARADSSPCADRGQNVVCMADDNAKAAIDEDVCGTLKVGGTADSCVLKIRQGKAGGGKGALIGEEVSFTLATSQDQTLFDGTGTGYVVRRLTPVECERLQGFPSKWTDVPYKGKEHPSDTPRYKACGNSMAVPVMRWIGERIQMVDEMEEDE